MKIEVNYSPTEINNSPNNSYHSTYQNQWLNRLDSLVEKMSNTTDFNNETLARELAISERQLFRKVKKITGLSPQKYLKQLRLKMAMDYLESGAFRTVKETAHAVGYVNSSYFIKQFEEVYGLKPFKVLQDAGWR